MSDSDEGSPLRQHFRVLGDSSIRGVLWSPTILGFTIVIYALSRIANELLFSYMIASASIFGVLYFSNAHPPQQVFTQQRYSISSDRNGADAVDKRLDQDEDYLTKLNLFYHPLTKIVDQLLQYFYDDFVHYWWNPLNSEYDNEFEKIIKSRLNTAVTNVEKTLLKQERNDIVMAIMYGLANTLIIHMRECRTFETSEIPMDAYVVENPQSPFAQLLSKKEQHHQLRSLSTTILRRILPIDDMDSVLVSSIFKELLSTHLLENILATCSDPDFVNGWIIQYLSDTLNGLDDTHPDSILTDSDGLRSVVEKATEDAMAAEQQQRHQHDELSHNPSSTNRQNDSPNKLDDTLENSHNSIEIGDTVDITNDQGCTTPPQCLPISQHNIPSASEPPNNPRPQVDHKSPTYDASIPTTVHDNSQPMARTKTELTMDKSPLIYVPGTVSFSIMDISPRQNMATLDKSSLAYIIQIERPALEQSSGSEGGGYVITRTYSDFDTFHGLMRAKHGKRVTRLNLRLPLDVTRSWLGKKKSAIGNGIGTSSASSSIGSDGKIISHGLENYLNTVVGDDELGRDPLILAFLQKEQATQQGATQNKHNFAEEYKDELAAYTVAPLAVDTTSVLPTSMGTRAMSLFGRASISNGNTPTSWSPSLWSSNSSSSSQSDLTGGMFKSARQGSISSMKSNSDSTTSSKNLEDDHEQTVGSNTKEDNQWQQKYDDSSAPVPASSKNGNNYNSSSPQKPLSAMDTELLIETTFALIVEIFDLTTANNKAWMRRSLLNLLREIVRRSYTELVAKQYNDYMQAYLSPNALVGWMELVRDTFWPNGVYNMNTIERTIEEKRQTKQLAKQLLVQRAVPGGVRQLIGDQNCTLAMERIWNRLQDEELNRVLILQVLERVVKPLFG
ncbi:PXA domain-domain-containing protein [Absidia repens]|uniref:PXA domain-domain-containing protein n=1 Tax=Absidia repens TaxID=90262 RepID=A0A1X2IZ49_9FUNG|nr:PXA domain-domain-containing protein [Absidia repens]